MLINLK
jgi:DNA topoisomerase-3